MKIETLIINRKHRPTIKASRHTADDSVIVRTGRSWMQFDADDLQQLSDFATNRARLQRFAAPTGPQGDA